jgi:hypothetical protein
VSDQAAARAQAATLRRLNAQKPIARIGLPFYRAMIERTGFGADIEAYDHAAGDLEAMRGAISEEFLQELTAIGDEGEVQASLERYRDAGATSPSVGPIAKTDFDATLRAGIGSLRLPRA